MPENLLGKYIDSITETLINEISDLQETDRSDVHDLVMNRVLGEVEEFLSDNLKPEESTEFKTNCDKALQDNDLANYLNAIYIGLKNIPDVESLLDKRMEPFKKELLIKLI